MRTTPSSRSPPSGGELELPVHRLENGTQLARWKQRLDQGTAVAGSGADQRWSLARVVAWIATLFHIRVGITTALHAMRRLGYTAQMPIHRAVERDEAAIADWRRYQWPALKESLPAGVRGSASLTSVARR